jgi:hypothetical protein
MKVFDAPETMSPKISGRPVDPVFAAIDRHRAKSEMLQRICDDIAALEPAIPPARRQSHIAEDRLVLAEADDRRWAELQERGFRAFEAEDRQTLALLETEPTTFAGLAALLEYLGEAADAARASDASPSDRDSMLVDDHLLATLNAAMRKLSAA